MKTRIWNKITAIAMIGFFVFANLPGTPLSVYADPPEARGSDRSHEVTSGGTSAGGCGSSTLLETTPIVTTEVSIPETPEAMPVSSPEVASPSNNTGLEIAEAQVADHEKPEGHGASDRHLELPHQGNDGGSFGNDPLQEVLNRGNDRALELARSEVGQLESLGDHQFETAMTEMVDPALPDHQRQVAVEEILLNSDLPENEAREAHAPFEMLDPYGHSKDDRKEIYGNRGRASLRGLEEVPTESEPVDEIPTEDPQVPDDSSETADPAEEPPTDNVTSQPTTFTSTQYVSVDMYTIVAWWNNYYLNNYGRAHTPVSFESLGYSAEEAAFLASLTHEQVVGAYYEGFTTLSTTEATLASISELDLSNIIDYVDSSRFWYLPGQTVSYDLSLTNSYDAPLTLSAESTITYTLQEPLTWGVNPTWEMRDPITTSLVGDSTQIWETITLQPGETLVLTDTYTMPTLSDYYATYWRTFQYDVTLTDLSSGTTYSDPGAGWFESGITNW